MPEIKIMLGNWEATAILITVFNTQIFLNFCRNNEDIAGTAGWIMVLYFSITALIAFFIIVKLYRPFEGMDMLDIGQIAAGGTGRVITGLIVIMFFLLIVPVTLREFGEDIKTIAFPTSPISYVMFFFIGAVIIAAYAGIEAIARFHAYAVPVIIAGFLIIILGIAPYYDVSNIFPILGNGPRAIFMEGFSRISCYSGFLALFLLAPFIKSHRNFKLTGYMAWGFTILFMTASTLVYIMVYPYPAGVENLLPIYQMARLINYGRLFQRIESIFVVIWAAAAFSYLSTAFFLMVYTFRKIFGLDYYRPLVFPFAVIVFAMCFIPRNLMMSINIESNIFRVWSGAVTFGLMILLLIAANIRNRIAKKAGGGI